jgi:hypothetical protein
MPSARLKDSIPFEVCPLATLTPTTKIGVLSLSRWVALSGGPRMPP